MSERLQCLCTCSIPNLRRGAVLRAEQGGLPGAALSSLDVPCLFPAAGDH